MARMDGRIALLLEFLDQAFDSHSWHGTTLRGALKGLTPREALWRPGSKRHNIWELVLHAAYWKYAVARRLAGAPRGSFPRAPSNWPRLPARPDAAAWVADVALLDIQHVLLRETVRRLSPAKLDARSPKGTWTNAEQIHGVAAHDGYHTGQVQLIKRLNEERR
ncbi:MAG: DinB family protein [Gemmatimonadales bacterium]|nr:DinB family protein [Gemmatimonadales bacterium]